MFALGPRDLCGEGVKHGLPVLVALEGSNHLAGVVGIRGSQCMHAAQCARARFEDVGRARGLGPGNHVPVGVGALGSLACPHQGVESEGGACFSIVESRGPHVPLAVRGQRVEDRWLTPGPVEAQEGYGQVGLPLGTRGKAHEAVQEGARGGVLGGVGREVGARRHVNADGGLPARGDGHARAFPRRRGGAAERNVHAMASPIRGVLREEAAVDDLRERLGAQLVGHGGRAQIVQGDIKVPAISPIPQVRLGSGRLGSTLHGRVHGRGRGRVGVDQASALLARRVVGAGGLLRVDQGARGAHDEVLDDVNLLACTHRGEERIGLDALEDDRVDARHLRGRHGSAGRVFVVAAGD